MISRSISIGAALAIAGSLAMAPPALAQKYGGTLKIGMNGDVKSPNFAKNSGNSVVQYGGLIAESLVDYDKQCNMVPGLAHKWEISPDAKAVTYHLRKGVLFHNGRELTADVVKKNVEWRLNKKNKGTFPALSVSYCLGGRCTCDPTRFVPPLFVLLYLSVGSKFEFCL